MEYTSFLASLKSHNHSISDISSFEENSSKFITAIRLQTPSLLTCEQNLLINSYEMDYMILFYTAFALKGICTFKKYTNGNNINAVKDLNDCLKISEHISDIIYQILNFGSLKKILGLDLRINQVVIALGLNFDLTHLTYNQRQTFEKIIHSSFTE